MPPSAASCPGNDIFLFFFSHLPTFFYENWPLGCPQGWMPGAVAPSAPPSARHWNNIVYIPSMSLSLKLMAWNCNQQLLLNFTFRVTSKVSSNMYVEEQTSPTVDDRECRGLAYRYSNSCAISKMVDFAANFERKLERNDSNWTGKASEISVSYCLANNSASDMLTFSAFCRSALHVLRVRFA